MVSIGVCGAAELAQAVPETFLRSNSLHTRVCCAHSHGNPGREGLYPAHLADEETEAQRNYEACQAGSRRLGHSSPH